MNRSAVVGFASLFCCVLGLSNCGSNPQMAQQPTVQPTVSAATLLAPTQQPQATATLATNAPVPTTEPPTSTAAQTELPAPTAATEVQSYYLGTTPAGITRRGVVDIPPEKIAAVGGSVNATINGIPIIATLKSFERTSPNPQLFNTAMTIRNNGNSAITINPKDAFFGRNETQMRYSRGGAAYVQNNEPVTIEAGAESELTLEWDSNRDFGKVWITVNAPISEGNTVTLDADSGVFLIELPKV